jgi:hypothetical protein
MYDPTLGYFNYGPEKLLPHSVPKGPKSGKLKTRDGLVRGNFFLLQTARPSGYFNYDKIFERGTTRLWVILIMLF